MSLDHQSKVRQRVTTACVGCRDKKTKCDGHIGQCSACSYRNQECVYLFTENKRKPPSKNYVKALEARVESLEKQLARARAATQQSRPLPILDDFARPFATSPSAGDTNLLDEVANTLGRFCIADGGEVRFFGSRSNFNLLQTAIVSKKSSRQMQIEGFNAAQTQIQPLDLSPELCDHLLHLYWTWQNPWHYFVSPTLLLASIQKDPTSLYGTFHCPLLLTTIYSLASRYSDRLEFRTNPDDPNTAGDTFLAQAKVMLQYESEAPTTRTVQAVLLMSLCEVARDKEALGFVYCGMATRMALNLGLHIDSSPCISEGLLTAEEVQDRQVTWWGVYMLDKLYNIGLGRPSMILERDITAVMPSLDFPDESLSWDGNNEPTKAPILAPCHYVSLAQYTRELFSATTEVLDVIYSPSCNLDRIKKDDLLSKAHVKLVSFFNSVPTYLRLPKSPHDKSVVVTPQLYQFHLQYHVIVILLHRPFLRITRSPSGAVTGKLEDGDAHAEACRSAAEWITNILRWQKDSYDLRYAVVSTVHCAFTAAVIWLAFAATDDEKIRLKAIRNLNVCVESLEEMETAWAWSTRSLIAIRNIAQAWKIQTIAFDKARYQTLISPNGSQWENSALQYLQADEYFQGILADWQFDLIPNNTMSQAEVFATDYSTDVQSSSSSTQWHNLF